jgi:ankyrin repeat protein
MVLRLFILILIACGVTAVMVTPRYDLRCLAQMAVHANDDDHVGWTCLHYAALRGDSSVLRDMLEYGADVNTRSEAGRTPLAVAARAGQGHIVQQLIDANADLNAQDDISGLSPLHLAAEQHHPAIVRRLLQAGARVDITNQWQQTPLWLAAWQTWQGNTEIARILVAQGADLQKADEKGHTPLHMAARAGHTLMVDYLLREGADIEHRNINGRTPLFQAVVGNHPRTVAALLERGADPNAVNEGWTPLRIALQENHLAIADLLQSHGARGYERMAADARINQGYVLLQAEDYDQAISAFDEAVALEPESSRGYYYRGLAYHRSGQDAQAQADLLRSLQLDPGNASALEWMANLYAGLGEHGRAREMLQRLIKIKPDYGKAYYLLGETLSRLGDENAAREDRQRACALGYQPAC